MGDASFPAPFVSGLEFSAPARGTWNIVHIGMLIPGAHQIFVCASGCLRGVVLTAAEMGLSDRFSTITIKENNVLEGDMEQLIIDGVTNILGRLKKLPPAVLVYTSCIHHFMGCDLELCYRELRSRFPGVAFTDCYMNPIMRKSGLTPDQLMRRQLYSLLEPQPLNEKAVNLIGNNIPTDPTSDLVRMIRKNGFKLQDITLCSTYEEYQQMAAGSISITYNPVARAAGDTLEKRLGQRHLHLPLCYGADEIRRNMQLLADALGVSYDGGIEEEQAALDALAHARSVIGDAPIAIDYTATTRPLGLARLLLEQGFNVQQIYADSFIPAEKEDFDWLKANYPALKLYATVQVKLRVLPRGSEEKLLAIGQKAAYFTGSDHFVNIVEGGGMYGFDGIKNLAGLMEDAFINPKDAKQLIQQKGLGCGCCL